MTLRRLPSSASLTASILLAGSAARAETLSVFAAASLGEAFKAIAKEYETAHSGTTVELNFAGSSTLARQITEGAPADVFASADEENMQKAGGEVAGTPQIFARNQLAILVQKGNPKGIAGLADLGRQGLTIALAAPAVPVGRYAREAFAKATVPAPAGSDEADVKAVATRVSMGEADAGIVYTTDVRAGGETIDAIALPDAHNVLARYPIAALKHGKNADGARAFVAHVLSPAGQRVLAAAGFLAP